MAVTILLEPCINCGLCRKACPTETIHFFTTGKRTHVVDPAGCIDCDICIPICPEKCIVRDETYVHEPEVLATAKVRARDWAKRQNGLRQRVKERAARAIAAVN
ncbi:MAG: indolepyruvate ferredoxin oxidoreductase subunit alpha [Dehalococcoidia bacterium]